MAADLPAAPVAPTGISEETLQQLRESLLHPELVPIDRISRHPENARRGDVQSIRESLREHGQYKALIVQRSTGHVLAGNHTLQGMTDEGWEQVVVAYLDVDDDEARRILLVDNRTSDLATYDDQALLDVLKALDQDVGLAGTGYSPDDVTELRRLTGEIGREQSAFLDDLAAGADAQNQHGGRNHFQVTFPVSEEQRDKINRALRQVQSDRKLNSSVEALVALADDVLKAAEKPPATLKAAGKGRAAAAAQ